MCYEWMSLLDELNVTTVTDTVENINNDDNNNNNNVNNKMCLSCLTGNDSCSCSFCLFKMKSLDELDVLMRDLEKERSERTLIEEAEMKRNWRYLLQKQSANALRRAEYERDDEIDLNAYLNEIEMNVDYSQYDCVYQYWFNNFDKCDQQLNVEMNENLIMVEDQLLKFRNNRQAFNLRNYHMWLEEQQRFKSQSQNNSKHNSSMSIFANVKLDSIQEFVPLNVDNNNNTNLDECVINSIDYRNEYEQKCEVEVEDGEEDTATCHHSEDDNEEYVLDEVEIIEDEHAMMLMMCEQDEQTEQEYINYYYNDDLIENNHETTLKYFEMDTTLIENSVDATKSNDEFISNTPNNKMDDKYHIPFTNDDDQIFIDSLSEEEALNLLRSESELFALQMAQASKYGLLKNSNKSDLKNKGKKKGSTQRQPQLLEQEQKKTQIEDDTFSKSDDIFENVFNYDNQIADDNNNNSQDNNYKYENLSPSIGVLSNKKNISLSLRNSLLKLIHSRKHLASLIESKGFNGKIINTNSSSTSSSPLSVTASSSSTSTSTSTTSSLTSSFNINLYKHHINGQPIVSSSASSRKPCVYMLNEGRCMRADCRFVHDLKTIMCKYWLEGECLKGENCEFLHDYINEDDYPTSGSSISSTVSSTSKKFNLKSKRRDANSASANTIITSNKKDFKLDSEEFPALGLASSFTPTSTCGTTSTSSVTSTTNTTTLASLIKTTANKNYKSSQTNAKSAKNKTSSAIVTQSPTKQALQVTTVSIAPTSENISKKTFLHTLTDSVITTPSTSSTASTKSTTSSTNKTIAKQNSAVAAKPTVKQNQFSKSLTIKTSISNQIKAKIK